MCAKILISLLVFSGLVRGIVFSCTPPPNTPLCQFPAKIAVTFIGTAIATNYDPNPPGGSDVAFLRMWYRFSVEEAFTGLRPTEREIVTYLSVGGGSPELGKRFFVHAQREGDAFRLIGCGITQPVEQAADEIQYLRARLRGDFKPYIAGSVLRHYKGSQYAIESDLDGRPRGLAGLSVSLSGPSGLLRVFTDGGGHYRISDVSPGMYWVSVQSPGYQVPRTFNVDVPQDGCGIAHIGMFTNASISGVVRRADGMPAARVKLDLIDVDPSYGSITTNILRRLETGPRGEFSLTSLPSGRFLLGVNIWESTRYPDQTPPSYYPGVGARAQAQVIELQPNELRKELVLTLLPPRAFRAVRVHLRWPDGSVPNRGAMNAWANKGIYLSDYDLKNGVFTLKLLQGVDYWLDAAALDESRKPSQFARGTWVYADNYRLTGGSDDVDIIMTALFDEPQWSKAIYPAREGAK